MRSATVPPCAITFKEVYKRELLQLNARRRALGRILVQEVEGATTRPASSELADGVVPLTSGLSFSGGGIRSAAFCLGTLQALKVGEKFDTLDYISAVSGGGYIASSLAANLYLGRGKFPFLSSNPGDIGDSPAVRHIRDYSRYLIPKGGKDVFDTLAVILRGLVASLSLAIGPVLLGAALTVGCYPSYAELSKPDFLGIPLSRLGLPPGAGFIPLALVLGTAFLLFWSLVKSFKERHDGSGGPEFVGPFPRLARLIIVITLIVAFIELQPHAIAGLFKIADLAEDGGFEVIIAHGMKWSAGILTPLGGLAAIMFRHLSAMAAKETGDSWPGWVTKIAAQIGLLIAAISVPLLLWAAYVYLCYWAIEAPGPHPFLQTPQWLLGLGSLIGPPSGYTFALLYLVTGICFVVVSSFLAPNANSLHRLYRDRLSNAFIFGPKTTNADSPSVIGADVRPEDADEVAIAKRVGLSKLANPYAPYPLFNVALNIQNSRYVNKRGRNADFFVLSPLYIGSESTGYAETTKAEIAEPDLDLGAAMAISGAALSPDMGSKTVPLLAPTLALLNVRLGYWMRNPVLIQGDDGRPAPPSNWVYLFQEMFGQLDESSHQVYLTDGGHIDGLGIYELLRRRCGTIIAIDANNDAEMTFYDFAKLQRYARIDLGIRIELPWQAIRERALAASAELTASVTLGTDPVRHTGPHAAWGRIFYPGGSEGRLLYIKASLTGDENDYILNYRWRHPAFPHENIADQFFSEEQFEAYRALGFHAAYKAIKDLDEVASTDRKESVAPRGEPTISLDDSSAAAG
jgi:Patatin-like phospholipase